jgi:hypothetical protein
MALPKVSFVSASNREAEPKSGTTSTMPGENATCILHKGRMLGDAKNCSGREVENTNSVISRGLRIVAQVDKSMPSRESHSGV